jgi:hypothetical protein
MMPTNVSNIRVLLALAIGGLAATGCENEYTIKDPDAITAEECEQLCDDAANEPMPFGCTLVACGIDAGDDWPSPETGVVDLGLMDLDEGGDYCQAVVDCQSGTCFDRYIQCVDESEGLDGCYQEYLDCFVENACATERAQCEIDAEAEWTDCLAANQMPDEDCDFWYEYDKEFCECLEDACLVGNDDPECGGLPLLPPPPVQTGPQRWRVSRALVDEQIARRDALTVEVGEWPVQNATGQWAGVRLTSIDAHDPLHLAGLRDQDLLVAINGVAIRQALASPAQLLALRNAKTVKVTIKRGAVSRVHTYDLVP